MGFFKNKLAIVIVISVFFTGGIMLLANLDTFKNWQLFFADALYQGKNPSSQIIIVNVDQKTIDPEGLGEYNNWNRNNFARVLQNINKYEPKVIAFDFFFRAAKDEEGDSTLKSALEQTKNPVIMYPGNPQAYDNQRGYYINPKDQKEVILPLDLFRNLENIGISIANTVKDEDSVIRRMIAIIYDEKLERYDENLSFVVARKALDGEDLPKEPFARADQYKMKLKNGKEINIPLEEGLMLINFFSKPGEYPYQSVSFLDVYNENYNQIGNSPESFFKDKIVLIGPKANFFNDLYVTPASLANRMPGVELQANALQTILEQKFLRNLTFPEKAILIVILALASAFVFMFTKIRWSLLYLVTVPLAYSFAAKPVFDNGIILDLVHPYLTIITIFMAVYLYRYVTEFREKLELQGAFSKYVNPTVAKQVAEHPESLKLGGEKREVTVMFTDIVHFTNISETLKPESLVALLNEYFNAMSEVIMNEGGTVDKYEGDLIMAFFGAPVPQADHALRAANAALKMRFTLNELLAKWKNAQPGSPENTLPGGEPKPQIDFRCGLSSGEVIVGNIGASNRFNYTVMGDIVNLGSRLEGQNKEYSTNIMMSEKMHDIIKDQFETRELDIIQVVGKTEPIKVFELIAPKGQLSPEILELLRQYNEAMALYHARKFAEAHTKFTEILKAFPNDGPTKLYCERSEIYSNYPPPENWDGVSKKNLK